MSDIGLDNATLKATRPASRWRNRYFAFHDFTHPSTSIFRRGGEEYLANRDWPSRDVAETKGQEIEANHGYWVKYLGAFPVDA